MNNKKDVIVCACNNATHNIITSFWDEEGDQREVYVYISLGKTTFWKRLKLGVKYIFGKTYRYGNYDEFLIDKTNIDGFKKMVEFIESDPYKNGSNIN